MFFFCFFVGKCYAYCQWCIVGKTFYKCCFRVNSWFADFVFMKFKTPVLAGKIINR